MDQRRVKATALAADHNDVTYIQWGIFCFAAASNHTS
jgi:hypothetical protein